MVSRYKRFGPVQNIAVPISPVEGPISPANRRSCSKIDAHRHDEVFAVEVTTDRDFDAGEMLLDLKFLYFARPAFLIALKNRDDIPTIVFSPHE